MLFDRRRRNAEEYRLEGADLDIDSGMRLLDMEVPAGHKLLVNSDDVQDMFPAFDVTPARAESNAVAVRARAVDFEGTRAGRRAKLAPGRPVVPCAQSLVMGDLNAPCWACGSHRGVLAQDPAVHPSTGRVLNGCPFPEGEAVEIVVIDDRVGCCVVPRTEARSPPSVRHSFDRGAQLLEAAGLRTHRSKSVRDAVHAVPLGVELRGDLPRGEAERMRRACLAQISVHLAGHGRVSGATMQILNSHWTYALEARRLVSCVMDRVFKDMPDAADLNRVFALSSRARDEYVGLAICAPLLARDLGARFSSSVVCTDASDDRGAVCRTCITPELHRHFWRHRERRRTYTWLRSRLAASFARRGQEKELADLEETLAATSMSPDRVLAEVFDFIEICSGREAPLTEAMAKEGLRVGPRIEICLHRLFDLGELRILEWVLFLVQHDRVWYTHTAAPCRLFSIARHPRCRSHEIPEGFDRSDHDVKRSNLIFLRSLAVLFAILVSSCRHGSHEHPASAYSWWWHLVTWLFSQPACGKVTFDVCAFILPSLTASARQECSTRAGAERHKVIRKRTTLGRIRAPWLEGLRRSCTGHHAHLRLEGSVTGRSAQYHHSLCKEWARLTAEAHRAEAPCLATDDLVQASRPVRPAFESLAVNELMRAAQWHEQASFSLPRHAHINIKELRAAVHAITKEAEAGFRVKQLYFHDSRVALGCLVSGRSAAPSLNRELKPLLPACFRSNTIPGTTLPLSAASR